VHSTPVRVFPSEYYYTVWCEKKPKMVWLADGKISLRIRLAVSTEYRRVTDRRMTNGRTDILQQHSLRYA